MSAPRGHRRAVSCCVFGLVALLALSLCLWKCRFGFDYSDEPFYLTIPYRLLKGDALFVDEWHVSQLSGFLLVPFVWLYRAFTGGMDGIMLCARYCYTLGHFAAAAFVFLRLRRYGLPAFLAALSFFLFCPHEITAYSYNTLALDALALCGALLSGGGFTRAPWLQYVLAGLFFAVAVLCCPYLVTLYLVYALCCLLFARRRSVPMFTVKALALFTLGAAVLAAVFLGFLFSRAPLSSLLENVSFILTDPEHPPMSVHDKLSNGFWSTLLCTPGFQYALFAYALLLLALLLDKRRMARRGLYLALSASVALVSYALFYPRSLEKFYNAVMLPMIFPGLVSYILCRSKPKALFFSFFCVGCVYAVCLIFTSNLYFFAISMAMSVTNIASFVFVGVLLSELNEDGAFRSSRLLSVSAAALAALCVLALLLMQLNIKLNRCYFDDPPTYGEKLRLSGGPADGIYTSPGNAAAYSALRSDLAHYDSAAPGGVLFLTSKTWPYLDAESLSFGTYSAWLSIDQENTFNRLQQFYSVNPEKIPRYIYLPMDTPFDAPALLESARSHGAAVYAGEAGYFIEVK